jgi:hypothetical protein
MTCTNPALAYRKTNGGINFMRRSDYDAPHAHKILMPCGKCTSCLKAKARTWALRMSNEAQMHDQNCFITLTFDDDHLPKYNSLSLEHPQKFLKRLRKFITKDQPDLKIKNFYCGEYGSKGGRAHYHACIFGWKPNDLELFTQTPTGNLYISKILQKLWPYGHSTVADFSEATAGYVANYVLKAQLLEDLSDYQVTDPVTGEIFQRMMPFQRMSRNPGLGSTFYEKFKSDFINHDSFRLGNASLPTPNAYLRKLKEEDPEHYENLKRLRNNNAIEYAERNPHLKTMYGLNAVETILNQRIDNQNRKIS